MNYFPTQTETHLYSIARRVILFLRSRHWSDRESSLIFYYNKQHGSQLRRK